MKMRFNHDASVQPGRAEDYHGQTASPYDTCKIHLGLFPSPRYCGHTDTSWVAVRHWQHVAAHITTGCGLVQRDDRSGGFHVSTLIPSRLSPHHGPTLPPVEFTLFVSPDPKIPHCHLLMPCTVLPSLPTAPLNLPSENSPLLVDWMATPPLFLRPCFTSPNLATSTSVLASIPR